jgi:O-methyltransferase
MFRRHRAEPAEPAVIPATAPGPADPPRRTSPLNWPAVPPDRYLGQLDAGHQARLADLHAGIGPEDCSFYHAADLPDGEVPGAWDLRGREQTYLGDVEVGGRRILELGPASGAVTRWLEARGAEVVCFDVGYDAAVDLLPFPGATPAAEARDRSEAMRGEGIVGVQNSWWYLRRRLNSQARMVYGDIYALPGDLGRFDLAVFGAILLHLRDPWTALAQAAAVTDDTIVVVDLVQGGLDTESEGAMRFDPLVAPEYRAIWWALSPGAVVAMLRRLGFTNSRVAFHKQPHHLGHRLDEPQTMMEMFTVVASR